MFFINTTNMVSSINNISSTDDLNLPKSITVKAKHKTTTTTTIILNTKDPVLPPFPKLLE